MGFLAAAAAMAILRPAAAGALQRPTAWQMDWGQQFCTLVRLSDQATPFATAFRVTPGMDDPIIAMIRRESEPLPRGITAIALAPTGRTLHVAAARTEGSLGGQPVLVLGGLHSDFWDALRGANELQLLAGNRVRRRIALPQAAAAVAALRQCISQAMRDWGVDEAALSALRERPSSTNFLGMRASDYPTGAIRSSTQGRVGCGLRLARTGARRNASRSGRAAARRSIPPPAG